MSSASLYSSTLQSQISGLCGVGGLKLQRQNLSQPSSFTITRYLFVCFVLFFCFSLPNLIWVFVIFVDLRVGYGNFGCLEETQFGVSVILLEC